VTTLLPAGRFAVTIGLDAEASTVSKMTLYPYRSRRQRL